MSGQYTKNGPGRWHKGKQLPCRIRQAHGPGSRCLVDRAKTLYLEGKHKELVDLVLPELERMRILEEAA